MYIAVVLYFRGVPNFVIEIDPMSTTQFMYGWYGQVVTWLTKTIVALGGSLDKQCSVSVCCTLTCSVLYYITRIDYLKCKQLQFS